MHRLFCRIAGVDPAALEECPVTDRIWAAHLGLALVLNFFVVFGLTLYSVGYFLPELYSRVLVALVVAAVLMMFDRALFQFDWFTVAMLHEVRELHRGRKTLLQGVLAAARPFWRLSLRLLISLAIAYTLSVFAEIAAFDGAIRERLTADNYSENQPFRDRLADFEKELDGKRAAYTERIARLDGEIASMQKGFVSRTEQDEYETLRRNAADARTRITMLEGTLAENEKRIRDLNEDIYSERYGLKDKPYRTGRPGCEPGSVCNDLVLTVKETREANVALRNDIERLQRSAQEQDDKASELLKQRNAADAAQIDAKRREIATLRAEAAAFEAQRPALVSGYEAELKRDGTWRPLRDDPMIRIRVLDELRQDPVRGSGISQMSYLIKAFIAFLELSPVLGKIFFAPPTVYSARVRAAVAVGQSRALREIYEHVASPAIGEMRFYGLDTLDGPANRQGSAHQPEQLPPAPPRMLQTPPPAAEADKALPPVGLDGLNQFAVSTLRQWVEADPQHQRSAGDYYGTRLAQGELVQASDLAIAEYARGHFTRDARFFELGFGFGELSLCLALSGFRTLGFESDAGRYAGASTLAVALTQRGADTGNLSLVYGFFPDVLRLEWLEFTGESVLVSTNVTSTLMMEAFARVLRSLALFDHLIVDLSRFGEIRDTSSQQALTLHLHKLGFYEVARVYASGDTDVRHFRRRPKQAAAPP
ncbi:MAG: DUF4407 domain-containing protein [Alphaproteobacteria bacterium]|nr:DUF4407 domain-containing protein [Alphaproteobacteria bacterium]MBV8408379.1 DUF4407 domain-containing protein [Alphaproteobacteria bacterium]